MAIVPEILREEDEDVLSVALRRDLQRAAAELQPHEARYLVDCYYAIQESRKRSKNQALALSKSKEPNDLVIWLGGRMERLEGQVKAMLLSYAEAHAPGRWAMTVCGIGPVIAAGLLAYIDIERAPTVGHIWRFAGLDPTDKWLAKEDARKMVSGVCVERGPVTNTHLLELAKRSNQSVEDILKTMRFLQRLSPGEYPKIDRESLANALAMRPWNAGLKTLCWKIGESFVKVSNKPQDVYGKLYVERKEQEQAKNEVKAFAAQAEAILATKNIGKDTEAYKAYIQGMLPPAHIHARAKRWVVKLFLAHLQHVMYECRYGVPPSKPYILTRPEHTHYIKPPLWP